MYHPLPSPVTIFWKSILAKSLQSLIVIIIIAQRANDVGVTNLQFLSEFCHFSHFNDKSQTKVRNSLMLISVCLPQFRSINSNQSFIIGLSLWLSFLYFFFFPSLSENQTLLQNVHQRSILRFSIGILFHRVDLSELLICYLFDLLFFVLIQVSCKDYNSLEERYLSFYKEVVLLTARLAADWQCVGFCHGQGSGLLTQCFLGYFTQTERFCQRRRQLKLSQANIKLKINAIFKFKRFSGR